MGCNQLNKNKKSKPKQSRKFTSKSAILSVAVIVLLSSVMILVYHGIGEGGWADRNNDHGPDSLNMDTTTEEVPISDYSGTYYLHDDLPEHGQNIGNTHDVGDLLREQPHGNEERYCAKWVQFNFDEHIFGESTGDESYTITSIYYHIWWKSANEKADIGVEVHGLYDSSTDFSFSTSHDDVVSTVEKNGYWLTTGLQEVNYVEKDIHEMAVKVVSIDAIPSVYSGKNQYSFIILNLDKNNDLIQNDHDDDGLNDYDELFTYFTNPEDSDTDNDGLTDWEEVIEGDDGFKTDPNNFDMDIDDLPDGEDHNPLITNYEIIDEEWAVRGTESVIDVKLLVRNNIIIHDGGKLTIQNSVLKMNQEGEQFVIKVEKGGELHISDSTLITDDPDHWYSKTLQADHWHMERSFEIHGKASLIDNKIDYGSIIYIRASNETIIQGNEISHYYYGIFCSYSSPKIDDNTILPFIGNGIFLWYSSPYITNNVIRTYIGTGISCYYSSPIIRDCDISGGSNDFFLSCDSHPIVSNVNFNTSMVHVDDDSSSLLIGDFEASKNEYDGPERRINTTDYSDMGLIVLLILIGIIVFIFLSKKMLNFGNKNDNESKMVNQKAGKNSKIRPKKSWKGR
jgi:parallel beta-helix repeat protein